MELVRLVGPSWEVVERFHLYFVSVDVDSPTCCLITTFPFPLVALAMFTC